MAKVIHVNHGPKAEVVLVILDGWGIADDLKHNAVDCARKPNFDRIGKKYGIAPICASGECVGLTRGQMGNSEVGHLTIGAGRIIFQDLMRVSKEINSGKLARNKTLLSAWKRLEKRGGTLHYLGLVSDGGVHSHIDHLEALIKITRMHYTGKIVIHAFLDGRDTPPRSGASFVHRLLNLPGGISIGTLCGRYYAMDRDNRWERTKLAYDAVVYGSGKKFLDPIKYIKDSYERGVTDEFVIPGVNSLYSGMSDGDLAVFFNFRPDRARQLTRALTESKRYFRNQFDRNETDRPNIELVTMTIYDTRFKNVKALLDREIVKDTLSNVLEKHKIRQIHIAETEKYAHVTYFFNGLVERPRKFEDRVMIPSLKIETYDKRPEMSAEGIARESVKAIESGKYGFVLVNFANADMVGHSGRLKPTIKAVETVDMYLGMLINAWEKKPGNATLIVTADHGNAEKMYDQVTRQSHTAHTSNQVPLLVVSKKWKLGDTTNAGLIDIAPSILKMIGIRKPKVMTGRSIVEPIFN